MIMRIPRLMLALCSLLLAFGGYAHAKAFRGAASAIDNARLATMYAKDFKALWLIDSMTLFIVALFFALSAVRPSLATRFSLIVVASIPAVTATLIYIFVGSFYAGHLLLGTAGVAILAALWFPPTERTVLEVRR